MTGSVDVLIPTCGRPAALAVTLASLSAQDCPNFRIVISDQTEDGNPFLDAVVRAVLRLLSTGHEVEEHRHLPRRGMAEQRHFLLRHAKADRVLFLDDDLILEPWVLGLMLATLAEEKCGFVGCAPIGLSYIDDVRPEEQRIEFWEGLVQPEAVRPGSAAWSRYRVHNAANLYHLQKRLKLTPHTRRTYRVAWVGGCVLYDRMKLIEAGGFTFWERLPANHAGEDVLAQLRLMSLHGGCGIIPSGVYHQELPTTIPDRAYNAPVMIKI